MKLTKQDIVYLKEQLYESDENILQIRRSAIRVEMATDEYGTEPKRITHEEARNLLGNEQYLGAIDRCVFHRTATKKINGSTKVLSFENHSWRN